MSRRSDSDDDFDELGESEYQDASTFADDSEESPTSTGTSLNSSRDRALPTHMVTQLHHAVIERRGTSQPITRGKDSAISSDDLYAALSKFKSNRAPVRREESDLADKIGLVPKKSDKETDGETSSDKEKGKQKRKKAKRTPSASELIDRSSKLVPGASRSLDEWVPAPPPPEPPKASRGFLCYVNGTEGSDDSPPVTSLTPKVDKYWTSSDSEVELEEDSAIHRVIEQAAKNQEDSFDLTYHAINSSTCLLIATLMEKVPLKRLELNVSLVGDGGLSAISSLVSSCPLETLRLTGAQLQNRPGYTEFTASGLEVLVNALQENLTLRHLDLSHNRLTRDLLVLLITQLDTFVCLESLDLSGNNLGGKFAEDLANALQGSLTLTKLVLRESNLSTKEALVILESLRVNRRLRHICLETNENFSSKQLSSVTDLVLFNGSLTNLMLECGGVEISDSSRKKLDAALDANLAWGRKPIVSMRSETTPLGEYSRLDFSNCDLKEFTWNFDYTLLTELLLPDNQLTEVFSKINLLKNLEILHLQRNLLVSLPEELVGCSALKVLDVSSNHIVHLPDSICQIKTLRIFLAAHNKIVELPSTLGLMEKLQVLGVSHNRLKTFPEITCETLEVLRLDKNRIKVLPSALGSCKSLRELHLQHNELEGLPLSLGNLKRVQYLGLRGNPLTNLPRSIRHRGTDAILTHLRIPESSAEILSVVKLMIVGPPESGKRGLLEALFEKETLATAIQSWKKKKGTPTRRREDTISSECTLAVRNWTYDDIHFNSWDFSGNEAVIKSTFQFFKSKNSLYIIPFNVSTEDTEIDSWITSVASRVGNNPVMIIATNTDDKSLPKDFATEMLFCLHSRYRERFPNILAYMRLGRNKKGIREIRNQICEIVRQRGFAEHRVPSSHVILQRKLETFKEYMSQNTQLPVIETRELISMGKSLSLTEAQAKDAIEYLHHSGKLTIIEDGNQSLQNMMFFDPDWLINAFSKMYNYHSILIPEGRLLYRDLPTIWTEPSYPAQSHTMLLDIFQEFNVILPLPSEDVKDKAFIVPAFLPKERPERVIANWPTFEDNLQSINRIWEFRDLPPGFFPRLIARTSHLPVELAGVWCTGILVRSGSTNKALLEYNPSLFRLKLNVRVGELLDNFASLMITSINGFIEGWYPKQLKNVMLPCSHCLLEHSFDPFIFTLSDCELCAARGKRYAHCRGIRPVRIDLLAPDVAMADVEHLVRSEIILHNELGEGSFARVYRADYRGQEVAVKVIKLENDQSEVAESDEQLRERFVEFRREVSLMSGLDHPNLVELKGLCLDASEMLMVTEFLAYGDLYNFLHDEKQRIPWGLSLRISYDVAKGMKFLHTTTPPIIHRDLKTPNILLASNKTTARVVAKVADFGLSSTLVHSIAGRNVFNPTWLAPEVMVPGAEYTEKADVYSFGIILWELVTRQTPFDEFNISFSSELENQIIHKNLRPTIPSTTAKPFAKLIELCWHADPKRRPTFTKIVDVLKDMQEKNLPTLRGRGLSSVDLKSKVSKTMSGTPIPDPAEAEAGQAMTNYMAVSHATLSPIHSGSVKCMTVIDDRVWVGCGDGVINVWSSQTKQVVQEFQEHIEGIAKPPPINTMIRVDDYIWASQDNSLTIWSIKKMELVKRLKNQGYGALLSAGKNIWCATIEAPNAIHIRPKDNYKKIKKTISLGEPPAGCLLEVGDKVWVGTFQTIHVYNARDASKVVEYEGHTGMIHDLIRYGDHIWSCSSDKTIRVWDLNGTCVQVLEGHGSRVFQLLPHNGKIWSCSWDKTIMVWDPETLTFLQELVNLHDDAISSLVSVSSSKWPELWSGSWDKSICVIRVASFSKSQEDMQSGHMLSEIEDEMGGESEFEIVEMSEQIAKHFKKEKSQQLRRKKGLTVRISNLLNTPR